MTVTLINGVPIEIVGQMLGHKKRQQLSRIQEIIVKQFSSPTWSEQGAR
jgi:hypothetical protein